MVKPKELWVTQNNPPLRDRTVAELGVWGKDMGLLVSVLLDLEPPERGDNDGVDGSGDSCK